MVFWGMAHTNHTLVIKILEKVLIVSEDIALLMKYLLLGDKIWVIFLNLYGFVMI